MANEETVHKEIEEALRKATEVLIIDKLRLEEIQVQCDSALLVSVDDNRIINAILNNIRRITKGELDGILLDRYYREKNER